MGSPLVKQGQISRVYRNIQKTVEKKSFREWVRLVWKMMPDLVASETGHSRPSCGHIRPKIAENYGFWDFRDFPIFPYGCGAALFRAIYPGQTGRGHLELDSYPEFYMV